MVKVEYIRVTTPAGFTVKGKPSARITVANAWRDVRLHCVGEDDQEIAQFQLPAIPKILRELAAALSQTADAIEKWRRANYMPD